MSINFLPKKFMPYLPNVQRAGIIRESTKPENHLAYCPGRRITMDPITLAAIGICVLWTMVVLVYNIEILRRENAQLRNELSQALHSLAINDAAKEGDFERARLIAAVKTKPPVPAGAKEEKPEKKTGIKITQSG
jgi:hypothetical protein